MFRLLILFVAVLAGCQPATLPQAGQPAQEPSLHELLEPGYPLVSAHRGGRRYEGFPENAIETFEYVLSQTPAIIECDVSMTADSGLILMHDNTLDRTTTGNGRVSDYTLAQISQLYLVDDYGSATAIHPPTLPQTLDWAQRTGAVLTLDIKPGVPFQMVIRQIDSLQAHRNAVLIAYSAEAASAIYNLDSTLMISAGIRTTEALQRYLDAGIPPSSLTAFVGVSEPPAELYKALHKLGISCMIGTMGNLDNKAIALGDTLYHELVVRGADFIATDRPIEASAAMRALQEPASPAHQFWQKLSRRFAQ